MTLSGFTPWPEDLGRHYREAGWWTGVRLGDLPGRWAARSGDAEALVDGGRRWTYRQLAEDADRLALGLVDLGIRPGHHLLLQLPNTAEGLLLCFACFRIGARPVMALAAHGRHELAALAEVSGAVGLATTREGAPALDLWLEAGSFANPGLSGIGLAKLIHNRRAVEDDRGTLPVGPLLSTELARLDELAPHPDDVALFLLSGGTTGLPKLIPRTHDDYALNFRLSGQICGFQSSTRYLVVLPMTHNFPYGSPGLLGAWAHGGAVVLARSPNPAVALPLVAAERITHTAVVPAVAITWLDRRGDLTSDLSTLEVLQVGGARLGPETARRIGPELGCAVQQVFGMAEGLLCYTRLDEPDEWAVTTQGRPMCPDDEVRILDDLGNPVLEGGAGELLTRGPYTLRGYFRAPEHNARSFTPEGFYRTGDIVRRDRASGNLVIEGRSKDVVNRGGEKISADEIENLVLAHPRVHDVAAIAVPDAVLGERICVVVALHPDAPRLALEELRSFLIDRDIARFKLPDRLELVDSLPLTPVGKVDKKALRQQFR